MFENLTERLNQIFDGLRRRGKLSAADVDTAMREVRLALLEADVNYAVVKNFVESVRSRAVGVDVSKALNPGQQVIKIVNEELIRMLGDAVPLNLSGPKPRLIMLVGLQGSGKTTTAGKLAGMLRERGERILLAAGDPYRPAAAEQLRVLGERVGVPVVKDASMTPPDLARHALDQAVKGGYTVVILDTAGRSQLDGSLMEELQSIQKKTPPAETLLVVDAMIGQEAVNIAQGFDKTVPLTGLIMTKMDGDARGGAAISIRSVTGVPIKFIGTGEKLDALEAFHPERIASRILGMGDVLGLIEKAEAAFDAQKTDQQADRLVKGDFNLDDLLEMMRSSKKMGPIGQMLDMLPGDMGRAARKVSPGEVERSFKRTEAIISSMTAGERRSPDVLNASRRRRIAAGSGMDVQDVNRLMKQFREMQRMMKTMQKTGSRGLGRLFG